jgi:hypothetical protein
LKKIVATPGKTGRMPGLQALVVVNTRAGREVYNVPY